MKTKTILAALVLALCSVASAQSPDPSLVMAPHVGDVEIRAWSFSEEDGITIPDDLFRYTGDTYQNAENPSGPIAVTFDDALAGDVFVVDFRADTFSASPGKNCNVQVFAEEAAGATIPVVAGLASFSHSDTSPVVLLGHYTATVDGQIRFHVMGRQWPSPAAGSMGFAERAYLRVTRYTR